MRPFSAGITNVSNAFAGVGNPLVVVLDWKTGKPRQLKPKEEFQGTAWGVAFHPAGYVIAAGGVMTAQPVLADLLRTELLRRDGALRLHVLDEPPVVGALALALARRDSLSPRKVLS